jgi:hypothetical protein
MNLTKIYPIIFIAFSFIAMAASPILLQSVHYTYASDVHPQQDNIADPKAPMAVAGDNVYTTWWTNKSGNWEVMFRASNDGGATFGDKINLSNTTNADSENAEIVALEDSVFVSWWENSLQNGTSESVLRVSNDAGVTFGPMVMLGQNGTIGNAEQTTEGEATNEE